MFPTPRANKIGGYSSARFRPTLEQVVRAQYPTPKLGGLCGGTHTRGMVNKLQSAGLINTDEAKSIMAGNGGKLNPDWVDWLMGFPIGWTDLKPLAMPRFRLWLQQHGIS